MKIKLNQLSKIIIILFALLLLSCEKEETFSSNQEKEIKRNLELSEIPNLFNSIQNRKQDISQAKNSVDYLSLINTKNITEIIQSNGNKTYTFSLNINENDTLTNLVVVQKDNNYDYNLIQYISPQLEQWKTDVKNQVDPSVLVNIINMPLGLQNSTENFCTEFGRVCPSRIHHAGDEDICDFDSALWSFATYIVPCDDNSGSGNGGGSNGSGGIFPNPTPEPYTEPVFPTLTTEIVNYIANLSPSQTTWWNNADSNVKNDILNYLIQNTKNGIIKTEAQQFINELIDFMVNSINNNLTSLESIEVFNNIWYYVKAPNNDITTAFLTLDIYKNEVPWTPNVGNYNNIPSLHYTHKRTTNINGKQFYQYRMINGDVLGVMDYGVGQDIFMRTLYYSNDLKDWFFIPKPTPTYSYNHTDLDFLFNAFWSTVQTGVRYCTPLEDIIILIDGKDFDGVASSRATAGIFILVDLVPGGKVLKITKKAGHVLSATSPVIKVIIDATTKSQKILKKQYKNVIATASNARKGVFGEICTDIDFVEKGYEVLHINRKTAIDPIGNNTGIDHIFKNPETGEFIIVESKYHGTGGLSTLTDGTRQMSDNWIKGTNDNILNNENRLWMALGQDTSLYNQVKSNYQRVIAYIQADGSINYKYITSQGYEINTVQGVFTN